MANLQTVRRRHRSRPARLRARSTAPRTRRRARAGGCDRVSPRLIVGQRALDSDRGRTADACRRCHTHPPPLPVTAHWSTTPDPGQKIVFIEHSDGAGRPTSERQAHASPCTGLRRRLIPDHGRTRDDSHPLSAPAHSSSSARLADHSSRRSRHRADRQGSTPNTSLAEAPASIRRFRNRTSAPSVDVIGTSRTATLAHRN
jgi:hypothetical protein